MQDRIAKEPSILGLGDLYLKDRERIQPRRGRLDLLLQHNEELQRFEVEIQLGATDEAHIIRTIEYWDIERKRYPQYDHCAVLIAEDITSRFLNVIGLFNNTIPLIAMKMQAIEVGEHTTLIFTTVLDEFARGVVDEDEDADAAPADRDYWKSTASNNSLELVDKLLNLVKKNDSALELKYNKRYIGLSKDGQVSNFIRFIPKQNHVNMEAKVPENSEIAQRIDSESNLEVLQFSRRYGYFRLRIMESNVEADTEDITDVIKAAYSMWSNN